MHSPRQDNPLLSKMENLACILQALGTSFFSCQKTKIFRPKYEHDLYHDFTQLK
ncbi:hypothetical protein RV14_GL002118 [Enterococcus ratti]|uniref:Uncharacterized protein n=1 Tax=Enterococcus ratti TaxID=150033 RepID=A0A1L8WPA7_9ENTE|nr:hypothetical protein RV14_GL002118 [Enterococcus ratti]